MQNIIIRNLAMALLMFAIPFSVLAQGSQQGQGGQQQIGVESNTKTAIQKLNRVTERVNNPEIGEQIRSLVQNHDTTQTKAKTALQQMRQRSSAVKFLIGPDYKNAGQVRSDVISLRNNIKQLKQIKNTSLPTNAEDMQEAIDELQIETDGIEAQLTDQLSGFSLFGWLARMFAN